MEYKSIKGFSGGASMGFLLVFLGLGFILAAVAQIIILMNIMPPGSSILDAPAMTRAIMDPKNVATMRLGQVIGTFCLLFIPAVLYTWVTNGRNKFWLGFNPYLNLPQVLVAFGLIYAANICAGPLADWSRSIIAHFPSLDQMAKKLEDAYNEQVLALSNLRSWSEYIIAIFIMAFFPAMFEEVFFRGGLQNLLVRWWKKPLLAIIISSLIFSLIHMSVYLFLSRAVLGFVLGMIYHKSKNIWVNIIAHFLNNAVAVTMLFYLSTQNKTPDLSKIDPKVAWWAGLLGLAALIVLFRFFTRFSKENVAKIETKENVLLAKADPFSGFAENLND